MNSPRTIIRRLRILVFDDKNHLPKKRTGNLYSKLSELLSAQSVISVPVLTKEVIQEYFENKDCLFAFSGGDFYHQEQ